MEHSEFSCTNCGVYNCKTRASHFPAACPTVNGDERFLAEAMDDYRNDEWVGRIARASAEVEGQYYGKLTRAEEIVVFAQKIGAQRIGIATCIALIEESKIFAKILRAKHLDYYGIACKVGGVDKTAIGIAEECKVRPGQHESLCNPIMQAKLLNEKKTDLNVIVGLCVGHDSLFIKYSDAPVTTLITKDRVTGHNPAAALYTAHSFYSRLFEEEK